MQLVDLSVILVDMPYPVIRKLTVPLNLRLTDLHLVLQAAMGWDNSHLYDFSCGRSLRWWDSDMGYDGDSRPVSTATLAEVLLAMGRHKSFTYTYDMGDSWEHDLRPGKPREAAAGEAVIALHEAVGRCPPDDSGGAPGFDYMLECLADPSSDERDDFVEWLGSETWDPAADQADLARRMTVVTRKLAKRYAR